MLQRVDVGPGKATTKHAKGAKRGEERIVLKEQIRRIIGACFEVYKKKGHGFLEAVKQLTDEHRVSCYDSSKKNKSAHCLYHVLSRTNSGDIAFEVRREQGEFLRYLKKYCEKIFRGLTRKYRTSLD